MTDVWSERAEAYRHSPEHRHGPDLDLLVEWAEGQTALDVATGGGHTAQRLSDAGFEVTTLDPAPGMKADVLAPAEHIPFADGSFDVVVTRIAPHHFGDVRGAVGEMARVSRDLVLVVDNLFVSPAAEEADRIRDPSHVRNLNGPEWRSLFAAAGLELEDVQTMERAILLEPWLARTGCEGEDAERVRELVADRLEGDRLRLARIALRGRKRT
jgi:SAM-dependent methyltransferase